MSEKTKNKSLVSVVILTNNREQKIAKCLDSVKWADEIIVVDDKSTDRTVEIAHTTNIQTRYL